MFKLRVNPKFLVYTGKGIYSKLGKISLLLLKGEGLFFT